jgi:hypothetical protein
MGTGMVHAKALVKFANLGFLAMGAVAFAGSGGLGGCSSKSSSGSPESDAAGSSSGGPSDSSYLLPASDASGTIFSGGGPLDLPEDAATCAGAACNGLVIGDAPIIEEVLVAGSPPAFTGGTLVDGTYYLTSLVIYGADAGSSTVLDVTEEAGLGDDASGDGATGASSDGATSDATSSDSATGASSDAAGTGSSDAASSDAAGGDGASVDAGVPGGNGSFVESVLSLSAGATIAQFVSANGHQCTAGTVHVMTSGNMLTMPPFCGDPFSPTSSSTMTWPYTATATTITASVPVDGATAVLTYTMP